MKTALVTGAGKRIGRAIAVALAEDGWTVCAHYHASADEAASLVAEITAKGGRATALDADLGDAAQAAGLIARCRDVAGPPTALINNASLFEYDSPETVAEDLWRRHLDINLKAPVFLARDFAAALPEGETGCIVNILDQKLSNLNPDFFSYTIAKVGLEGATRMLAQALAPRIRVCGIAPGLTLPGAKQTEERFHRAHRLAALGRSSETADIVEGVRYALATPSFTGQTLTIDGGQHLLPLERDVAFKVW